MNENRLPHIITVAAFAVLIVLGLACASAPESEPKVTNVSNEIPEVTYEEVSLSELRQKIAQVISPGQGFTFEANVRITSGDYYISFPTGNTLWLYSHNNRQVVLHQHERFDSLEEYKRYDWDTIYRYYICVSFVDGRWQPYIDKIEGIRSLEEVVAIETQKREAQTEAIQRVRDNLIIGPSNFSPSGYTKSDLFAAVAASEKLQAYLDPGTYEELDIFGVYTRRFVSDVIFVSQNGTDITFRTDDNAISRHMKVDSRTGLTAGQKVRIYYQVYRIKDWRVEAIERL